MKVDIYIYSCLNFTDIFMVSCDAQDYIERATILTSTCNMLCRFVN